MPLRPTPPSSGPPGAIRLCLVPRLTIPLELLVEIFAHTPFNARLWAIGVVSKHWRRAALLSVRELNLAHPWRQASHQPRRDARAPPVPHRTQRAIFANAHNAADDAPHPQARRYLSRVGARGGGEGPAHVSLDALPAPHHTGDLLQRLRIRRHSAPPAPQAVPHCTLHSDHQLARRRCPCKDLARSQS